MASHAPCLCTAPAARHSIGDLKQVDDVNDSPHLFIIATLDSFAVDRHFFAACIPSAPGPVNARTTTHDRELNADLTCRLSSSPS